MADVEPLKGLKSPTMTDYDENEAKRLLANYADEHQADDPQLLEQTGAGKELMVALKKLNGTAGIAIEDHPQMQGRLVIRFPPEGRTAMVWAEYGEVFVGVPPEEKRVELYYNRLTRKLEGKEDDPFQAKPPERYLLKRSALAVVVETALAQLSR